MSSPTRYVDPDESNAHMVYIPVGIFGFFCPAFVCMRIWSRLRKGGKFGADDHTVIAALLFCLMSSGVMVASCHYGFGRHFETIELGNKYETLKYFYLCQISYKASINLTKCSILLLYLRIFKQIRWFRWACWFLIVCVSVYCVASVLATIFQCSPVEKAFNKSIPETCINNAQFWYANAGFSIATDVVILLIPMPLVYQLQLLRVQKIALIMVFALGGFVVITSCLRVTTIDIIANTTDMTYDISSTMWTIIEPNVAVICACLPMVRPVIVRIFPKLVSKRSFDENKFYAGRAYGSRSRATAGTRSKEQGDWIELGAGKSGVVMASVHAGSGSGNGSEESILAGGGRPQVVRSDSRMAIQKTIHYSVEHSQA